MPDHEEVEPEKTARVGAELVAREIARSIEKGVFVPGQRLREQQIADRFGLSRAPVREALRLLESQGVVVIEPMRGARVVRLDDSGFVELRLIRSSLSAVVAELAAAAPSSQKKKDFVLKAEGFLEELKNGACAETAYEVVRELNRALGALSPSIRAKSLLLSLGAGREILQMTGLRTKARRLQVGQTWLRMANAIERGDQKGASDAMRYLYTSALKFHLGKQ